MVSAEPLPAVAAPLDRRQRLLLGAIALAIPAGLLALTRLPLPLDDLRIVYTAAIADIVFFAGGALFWLARRRGGLAALDIRWSRVLRGGLIALLLAGLCARIAGLPLETWMLAPLLLVEAFVGVTVWRAVWRGWRDGTGTGWSRVEEALSTRLGPTLAAAAVGEMRIVGAALRSLTRRPIRRAADVHPAAGSSWRAIAIALTLVTVAEGVAVHALLAAFDITHPLLHGAMAVLHVAGVLWLLGDLRLMNETGHRIGADGVDVELGLRGRAHLPWAWIERLDAGELEPPDRLIGERWPAHLVPVTAGETPNITLHLNREATVHGLFGSTRRGTVIALYLDDPRAFAEAVTNARPAAGPADRTSA